MEEAVTHTPSAFTGIMKACDIDETNVPARNTVEIEDDEPVQHRKGALHLWQEVCFAIEQDIRQRRLSPGDRLATEEELGRRFQVHRNTVRRALDVLEEKGLIRIEHGLGSFVQERVIPHAMARQKTLPIILKGLDRVGREEILGSSTVRGSREIIPALHLAKSQYVRRVNLLTLIDDNPTMITSAYFPLPRFHGIDKAIAECGSVPEALKRLGIEEIIRYETRITTGHPTRMDAELLRQSRSQPVLKVKNIVTDAVNRPVLFTEVRMSARWIELVIRYNDL
ncbi:GntR family transcriptional regulator [Mesorhizobium dulcispinae]|uniref:GntR family transcriptional regulator n=1 Tax=Mesorhizobium dulcispinae TaxID=3072316 RepID=UPI002A240BEA|nr:UTRA domain-containing protein [Mesorhizobium sp. VK23D]MDX8521774.1 UTRA domain-containing protein [Mesorhizobium sp. VK23D]